MFFCSFREIGDCAYAAASLYRVFSRESLCVVFFFFFFFVRFFAFGDFFTFGGRRRLGDDGTPVDVSGDALCNGAGRSNEARLTINVSLYEGAKTTATEG